jgi:Flp pilus assembly protein TadB
MYHGRERGRPDDTYPASRQSTTSSGHHKPQHCKPAHVNTTGRKQGRAVSADATENDKESRRREELHDTLAAQARADQQASSDSYDNQTLTFASALLGFSLAFIKDIVPPNTAVWVPSLYVSWILLAVCILSVIVSFRFGIEAQKKHQVFLHAYYIQKNEEYLNKKSGWSTAISWCSYIGALTFLGGLVLTVSFAIRNISNSRSHAQQQSAQSTQNEKNSGTTAYQDAKSDRGASSSDHDPNSSGGKAVGATGQSRTKE